MHKRHKKLDADSTFAKASVFVPNGFIKGLKKGDFGIISHGFPRLSRAKEVKFVRIELIEGVRFLRLTAEDKFDTLLEHLKQALARQYVAR